MTTPVNFTWTTARSRADVREWVSTSFVDVMRRAGYRVRSDTPDELVLTRRGPMSRSLLLINLPAALYSLRQTSQVVVKFLSTSAGLTQVLIIGDLPRRVAAVLSELPQSTH